MVLKNFSKFLSDLFSLLLLFFSCVFFSYEASSQNYISTNDVVREIEKTLLFDKETSEKIDFYRKKNSSKKSDIVIKRGDQKDGQSGSEKVVDILVVDPKTNNFDIREKEKLAYNTALIGQYEVAVELYKQVLKAEPENDYAKFSLAVVYQKVNQFNQAKSLYYELLKSEPSNKEEIIGNLLAILIDESPQDAVYMLSRLVIQNPQSPYILAQTANAYEKMKNYDQAINLLKKAITMDSNNLDYSYNLAVIYDRMSDYDKALELYSEVEMRYSDENHSIPIDQVKKRIKSIKNKS